MQSVSAKSCVQINAALISAVGFPSLAHCYPAPADPWPSHLLPRLLSFVSPEMHCDKFTHRKSSRSMQESNSPYAALSADAHASPSAHLRMAESRCLSLSLRSRSVSYFGPRCCNVKSMPSVLLNNEHRPNILHGSEGFTFQLSLQTVSVGRS